MSNENEPAEPEVAATEETKPPKVPLGDKPKTFFDVETTGLDAIENEIIELAFVMEHHEGCWWPEDRWIRKLEALAMLGEPHSHFHHDSNALEFQIRIKPQRLETAHPKALEVNGYTDEGWEGQPYLDATFATVLVGLFGNVVLIGHNVGFDYEFLVRAIRGTGVKPKIGYHRIDTVTLAFEHLRELTDSLSLINVCPILGVTNENAHTALADVRRCREVYYKLIRATDQQRQEWASRSAKADSDV